MEVTTMAQSQDKQQSSEIQQVILDDPDFLRGLVEGIIQQLLDNEVTAHLGASPYERSGKRTGYRNGSYPRVRWRR